MNGQQRQEDGRAISRAFDAPWLFSIEVAITIFRGCKRSPLLPGVPGGSGVDQHRDWLAQKNVLYLTKTQFGFIMVPY